ncbi:UpxY family transcription antiterminator [Muricauda sp. MAR_2010_75]|uniref:UpxY family transcription antiterminator n=1 Tax=Allomuricauda sp. MAR_2010_75 TaxID=1250232 RepID=UPI0005643879|nr:UpxY family transcription antiterminator [Muricauda sp. MAR_2010_75]
MKSTTLNNTGWHVIYVRSKHEKSVDRSLQEQGLESFLPLTKTVRLWADRVKKIQAPLFPSYVFVNIKSKKEFYQAIQVKGACCYLSFGTEYAKVSDKEIQQIKCVLGIKDLSEIRTETIPKFLVGQMRQITSGPLKGLECEIVEIKNTQKVIVKISSLHQMISATLPLHFITH